MLHRKTFLCEGTFSQHIAPKKLTSTFSSQPSQQQMDRGEPFAKVRSEGPFPSCAWQNFGAANENYYSTHYLLMKVGIEQEPDSHT